MVREDGVPNETRTPSEFNGHDRITSKRKATVLIFIL